MIIVPTTTEEAVSESQRDRCRWLLGGRGAVGVAAARLAEELGLETEHGEGCAFGGEGRIGDDEDEDADADMGGETGTEMVVVDQRHSRGSSPAIEDAKEDDEDGVVVGSGSTDGWEDEWVGEGKSKDFWI